MLLNGEGAALTAGQIAAHLRVKVWNVTRELQLGRTQPHRLPGHKVLGKGVGQGGQWEVDRQVYLDWLQVPAEDQDHLGPDGLPELIGVADAAGKLGLPTAALLAFLRQRRIPHIAFGRQRYLTYRQLERTRDMLERDRVR